VFRQMKTMIMIVVILFSLTLILSACSDDGTNPENFKVTVVVTDTSGDPVPGLRLNLVPDTPYYQDGKSAGGRLAVAIPYSVAREGRIRLAITDVAGKQVRLLGEQDALAGIYHWIWDGHDDQERLLPPGVYTVHLTVWRQGESDPVYEGQHDLLMAILDPERWCAGTTDDNGRISLTDQRLFPHLYQWPDFPATDATGEQTGLIQLTGAMRFSLSDPVNGGHMRFIRNVDGPGSVNLVWDPPETGKKALETGPRSQPSAPASAMFLDEFQDELGLPYPNPFN